MLLHVLLRSRPANRLGNGIANFLPRWLTLRCSSAERHHATCPRGLTTVTMGVQGADVPILGSRSRPIASPRPSARYVSSAPTTTEASISILASPVHSLVNTQVHTSCSWTSKLMFPCDSTVSSSYRRPTKYSCCTASNRRHRSPRRTFSPVATSPRNKTGVSRIAKMPFASTPIPQCIASLLSESALRRADICWLDLKARQGMQVEVQAKVLVQERRFNY